MIAGERDAIVLERESHCGTRTDSQLVEELIHTSHRHAGESHCATLVVKGLQPSQSEVHASVKLKGEAPNLG